MSLVKQAQKIISNAVDKHAPNKVIAIDATIGNGNDTLFLAKLVANSGYVYGFDIQQNAVDITRKILENNSLEKNVTLLHCGHENLISALKPFRVENCFIIMFNLGYLPRSDKAVVTHSKTTNSAIQQSLSLLLPGGIISILAYPGHEGGLNETKSVTNLIRNLSTSEFECKHYVGDISKPSSPQLFIIEKQ